MNKEDYKAIAEIIRMCDTLNLNGLEYVEREEICIELADYFERFKQFNRKQFLIDCGEE